MSCVCFQEILEEDMDVIFRFRNTGFRKVVVVVAALTILLGGGSVHRAFAQDKVMSEVHFEGATKVERDAGVWVDGGYVGYLKELKGSKKIMLLPGDHEVVVRESGYDDFSQKIVVEPGQEKTVRVMLVKSPRAVTP